ncbi:MAG: nitroreductase family deazaflavin-dependent oxidoreductase [Chloroflexi bacterium]|nr:nitroreductase family deazaflavin-dependent oxidoreductase [Chloroflexota bacterium]
MSNVRNISGFAKAMMGFQAFMLRRNWMGGMSNFVMVITTTGRKSGKQFSTPIGYIRDGETLISLNPGGVSNWYKNLLAHPEVTLNIKGQDYRACAERISDQAEKERLFEIYKRDHAQVFPRLFGVPLSAPAAELAQALASREMVRFKLLV